VGHPNEFLRLSTTSKKLEELVAALCKRHSPENVAGLLLAHAKSLLTATLGPDLTKEALVQVASGRELATKETATTDARQEFEVRGHLLARQLGPSGAVDVLAGAATGVLLAAFGRQRAVEYFLNLSADLNAQPDPPKEEEA